ncbi:MAG: DMT family transporter [Chthoniobacteraceae bacterium]|nr:DMT family transporter [Chthoniobacteraceae bacterium]
MSPPSPRHGATYALLAALLFGVGTPLIKLRFATEDPLLLSALLNLGAALGVAVWTRIPWRLGALTLPCNRLPFAGSLLCGGVLAPVLLVWGIAHTPGSSAALLLNLEAGFTALLAWGFFRERLSARLVLGLALITAGGVLVSSSAADGGPGHAAAALAIAGSCLCWAIDNNCTARLQRVTPAQFALWKGLFAAAGLFALCAGRRTPLPGWPTLGEAVLLGTCCHGLALLVFVMALQRLGAGRTAAYFATAPFVGAAASIVLLGDPVTLPLLLAAALMAGGVASLLTEPVLNLTRPD